MHPGQPPAEILQELAARSLLDQPSPAELMAVKEVMFGLEDKAEERRRLPSGIPQSESTHRNVSGHSQRESLKKQAKAKDAEGAAQVSRGAAEHRRDPMGS